MNHTTRTSPPVASIFAERKVREAEANGRYLAPQPVKGNGGKLMNLLPYSTAAKRDEAWAFIYIGLEPPPPDA